MGLFSSIANVIIGNNSANKANDAIREAGINAQNQIRQGYEAARADQMPWMTGGQDATKRLQLLLGLNGDVNDASYGSLTKNFSANDLYDDPSYNFRMQEGEKALNRSASARGNILSGAAAKALTRYGQDYASTEYDKAFNRYNQNQTSLYNKLAGVSDAGRNSAQSIGAYGTNAANNIAELSTQMGNAQAQKSVTLGNNWMSGIKSVEEDALRAATGGMYPGSSFGNGGMLSGSAPMSDARSTQLGIRWY